MNNLPESAILLIDGSHGIYVPKVFADTYGAAMPYTELPTEEMNILHAGPDHAEYWDAWDYILSNEYLFELFPKATRYTLYQDGDLWAIPEDAEWPED